MQDFTKPFKLENEAKQLELNIPNQPKTGFIASRMNKDNFWNLVYFVGMFLGFGASELIAQPISGIIFWITIIGMPYLVKSNSNITFDKIDSKRLVFVVNGNKKIKIIGLEFILLLVTSFLITAVTKTDSMLVFFLIFWSVPALYCILRNIPIAVYFKKEALVGDGTVSYSPSSSSSYYSSNSRSTTSSFIGSSYSSSSFRSTTSSSSRDSIITSPSYRWHPSNIYHRR